MFRKIWAALMAWLESWTQATKAETQYKTELARWQAYEKRLKEKAHDAWKKYQTAIHASPPADSEHLARLLAICQAANDTLCSHRANKPKRPQD